MVIRVVDPNMLYLYPDTEICPNLDTDTKAIRYTGLHYLLKKKKIKWVFKKLNFFKKIFEKTIPK